MPITLITGLPGHGKGIYSLYSINKLQKESNRPVYYHNIKNLNLQWHELDNPREWINCPEGSIIVLDEAWQTFPLRPNAQTPPEYVAQLATHRHKGFDIFIITQQPSQLDTFVRKLVDKHYHLMRKFGSQSAVLHEFFGLNPDPQRARKNSVKKTFNYPKEVYSWYKSAEVHTVQTKRPFRIYFLWFGVPLLLATAIYGSYRYLNPVNGVIANGLQDQIHGGIPKDQTSSGTIKSANNQQKPELTYIQAHQPEIKDLTFTAPVYKELLKPVTVPYPAACVKMHGQCKCFTQQATHLDTSRELCEQIVEKGFFIEWKQEIQNAQNQRTNENKGIIKGEALDVDLTNSKPAQWRSASASPSNS